MLQLNSHLKKSRFLCYYDEISVWFEKLDKETLNLEQIQIKTGEGKLVGFGIYNSKEDFLKTSAEFKKLWMNFIKSFDGIVEFHEGDVVAHYKRKKEDEK